MFKSEIALREQVLAGLRSERTTTLSLAFLGGVFGAVCGWFTVAAGRWLWNSLLAVLRAVWSRVDRVKKRTMKDHIHG